MKINFKYSMPYDEMLSSMKGEELSSSQNVIAKTYIKELNGFWEKENERVVNAIEKASGLRFKKDVDCYVVSDMTFEAISHPFTLKMCLDYIWRDVNKIYHEFKNYKMGVVDFILENAAC